MNTITEPKLHRHRVIRFRWFCVCAAQDNEGHDLFFSCRLKFIQFHSRTDQFHFYHPVGFFFPFNYMRSDHIRRHNNAYRQWSQLFFILFNRLQDHFDRREFRSDRVVAQFGRHCSRHFHIRDDLIRNMRQVHQQRLGIDFQLVLQARRYLYGYLRRIDVGLEVCRLGWFLEFQSYLFHTHPLIQYHFDLFRLRRHNDYSAITKFIVCVQLVSHNNRLLVQ